MNAHHDPAVPLALHEADLLHRILMEDPRRRRVWRRHIQRQPADPHALHQAAVAQVLAIWLWEEGEVSESDTDLPRRMKDALSRALRGRVRLPVLLKEALIGSFELDEQTADLLWDPPCTCPRAA